jgi:hypothetical protein
MSFLSLEESGVEPLRAMTQYLNSNLKLSGKYSCLNNEVYEKHGP